MRSQQQIKVIGANGQLSLGKIYAGKMVSIEHTDPDTWVIKAGQFIPESEKWLYKKENIEKIERALSWAKAHKAQDNFEEIIRGIKNVKNKN
jgi:hypothetical protein